jgi:hypothetical protein
MGPAVREGDSVRWRGMKLPSRRTDGYHLSASFSEREGISYDRPIQIILKYVS